MNFERSNFFPYKNTYDLKKLKILLKNEILYDDFKYNFEIKDISSLSNLRDNSILFLDTDLKLQNINDKKICVLTNVKENKNYYNNTIIIKNFNNVYNNICNQLFYHEDQIGFFDDFNHENGSFISKYSKIDKSVEIGKNCFISRGVEIGKNSIIKNNVVIKNSLLGNNVVVCDNTSIGTSGFGFDFKKRGSINLNPQLGIAVIEDNVHIGASCTIDRGKIDVTYVGKNSMIDNMVHIAHNVIIGKNACIAAQTGISGSVKLGENVTIGGQAGFAGHITIGDNVIIAAKSGVTKNIRDNSVVAGFPAVDIKEWKKNIIRLRKYGYK